MKKCKHVLFDQHFVWETDSYAAKCVSSYEGANPAVLRLKMHLMCWEVDIFHRPDVKLVDTDYWFCLGVDIAYDPLLQDYLAFKMKTRFDNPPPTDLSPRPENMLYYRGPRIWETKRAAPSLDDLHIQLLPTKLFTSNGIGNATLSNIPVQFGNFGNMPLSPKAEA